MVGQDDSADSSNDARFRSETFQMRRTSSLSGASSRARRSTQGYFTPSAGSMGESSAGDFLMNDVDISRNYGHGTVPIPGRESHTADLNEFDRYVKIMEMADRLEQDLPWESEEDDDKEIGWIDEEGSLNPESSTTNIAMAAAAATFVKPSPKPRAMPRGMNIDISRLTKKNDDLPIDNESSGLTESDPFILNEARKYDPPPQDLALSQRAQYPFNSKFWVYVRSILSNAKPVGFKELPDPNSTISKGPDDATSFLSKLLAIAPLNPIQPTVLAKNGGFDEDEVLAELFYATLVGFVAMRFAPECIQCGSAVMETDMLGRVPSRALCAGCSKPNVIESLDKIKVMFLLNSEVLYILAENYACTPSAESMSVTPIFAAVPANFTGSGYSYCVGTGKDTEIAPALEPGKYRMHCPVAKTDNYLVVKRKTSEKDTAIPLSMKISDLVYSHKKGKKKAELHVPHGKIQFNIYPDTRSLFVLWVQKDLDDKTLIYLPEEERSPYTSASKVIHHSIFNALFQDKQVAAVQKNVFLSISNVVLVFTDIVDSTKLYASLGDGHAFKLVRKHFQVLFGAFTRNGGRVVKTIGDAVMASFTTGSAALKAVSEAMEMLPTIGRRPDNKNYIEIRVGIHSGRATVVPLNGVNDYFGQTANIAARVQSVAKASECFVTEAVLSAQDARAVYEEITGMGSPFKPTPLTELRLKGVNGEVQARGFRAVLRSRRNSELSGSKTTSAMYYMDRKVNRRYSMRNSVKSSDLLGDDNEDLLGLRHSAGPAEMGRRESNLGAGAQIEE